MQIVGLQRLSLSDYPGTPAAVVFLQGCNFNCSFCHNRDLIPMKSDKPEITREKVRGYLQERKGQVGGVVITGGEPTLHEELPNFLAYLKKTGVKIKLDTNGAYPENLQTILATKLVDYVAMDIKAPWEKYELIARTKIRISDVMKSMNYIAESGITHHFRTTRIAHLLGDKDFNSIKRQIPAGSRHVLQEFRSL